MPLLTRSIWASWRSGHGIHHEQTRVIRSSVLTIEYPQLLSPLNTRSVIVSHLPLPWTKSDSTNCHPRGRSQARFSSCVSALLAGCLIAGCSAAPQQSEAPAAVASTADAKPAAARNVILMIGDGMGAAHIGYLQLFAQRSPNSTFPDGTTAFDRLAADGEVSLSMTSSVDHLVVDSACSATQLATGQPALSETIGLDADGNPAQTILEYAESLGKATGLVTDTRITHATPAGFAAHVAHRSMESEIAVQMLSSGADVLLSAGLRSFVPQGASSDDGIEDIPYRYSSKRHDDLNLLQQARDKGYATVFDRDSMLHSDADRILGLFADAAMMDGIRDGSTRNDPDRTEPTLAEMTRKALDVLNEDEDGFFLMIEGGQIDWAGHNNDAGRMLHELLRFEEAIAVVLDWIEDRDDTLLVVTADHETGGFGISYSKANIEQPREVTGSGFADRPYEPNFNFGTNDELATLYAQKKSFFEILLEWNATEHRSPELLRELIVDATGLEMTIEEAEQVARNVENRWYVEGNYYLSAEETPAICDFPSFYVYGEGDRSASIARVLADQVNVTWGTGTHTHAPVPVFAYGMPTLEREFDRFLHHTDIGQLLFAGFGP